MKKIKIIFVLFVIFQCIYAQNTKKFSVSKGLYSGVEGDYIPLKNRAIGEIEVLSIEHIKEQERLKCEDNDAAPKTKEQMREYLYMHTPHYFDSHTFEMGVCRYIGKVKMFGRIWEFDSIGGQTILKAKITQREKDLLQKSYLCSNGVCYVELACISPMCHPKAFYQSYEIEEEVERILEECKECK